MMAHIQAYQNHLEKLVKCLPMDDAYFITKLSAQELLPGNIDSKIKALSTQADKAMYFLSNVIKPALDIAELLTSISFCLLWKSLVLHMCKN